ncbi:MAG: addiction module protein [Verrucomicrobia bacterium]|nr:addiction module protein [Verrucomicrobiota bacterium]
MTVADVKKLPATEKLKIMEPIWLDLREQIDNAEIPEAHRRLLDERRERVETGEARLQDWDDVKHTIGRS